MSNENSFFLSFFLSLNLYTMCSSDSSACLFRCSERKSNASWGGITCFKFPTLYGSFQAQLSRSRTLDNSTFLLILSEAPGQMLISGFLLYVGLNFTNFLLVIRIFAASFETCIVSRNKTRPQVLSWCFSDRASWIDYIIITNFCALIIIYS